MKSSTVFPRRFDVIVVGGGHAGAEAALAAARMGCATLLLTHSIETLGQMSCNPSIGGIGKGHLVREVDALGGAMALAADEAGIQFRTLNGSKGPAVRATRAQADRVLYRAAMRGRLENQPNLWLFQQAVDDVQVQGGRAVGVVTQMGLAFEARAVVLTTGTFLNGRIHIGLDNYAGGRAGVAIVRLSGPDAVPLARTTLRFGPNGFPPPREMRLAFLLDDRESPIDQVLVVLQSQERWQKKIIKLLFLNGVKIILPTEDCLQVLLFFLEAQSIEKMPFYVQEVLLK